jgi:hypothetical protein
VQFGVDFRCVESVTVVAIWSAGGRIKFVKLEISTIRQSSPHLWNSRSTVGV